MTVESYSRKLTADGEVKEEKRFLKTDYIKDTLFRVHFQQFFLDGVRQDDAALLKEARAHADRRRQGRSRDANINPADVFYPSKRSNYEFTFKGVETREGRACYHLIADCLVKDDSLIEGEYWFETEGLNLVYVGVPSGQTSRPAQTARHADVVRPRPTRYVVAGQVPLFGRGKVMLLIKFNFEVDETVFRPSGQHRIDGKLFQGDDG